MHEETFDDSLLAQALGAADDAVLITTPDLDEPGPRILYVNASFTAMTGYTLEEIRGKTPRILQGPETDRHLLDRLRRDLGSGQPFFGETTNYRKDGTPYSVEWRISPLRDHSGHVRYWVAIQRNVSQRRRFDEARERLAAIVESSDDAIIAKNLDGVITNWNPGAERLFGYTAAEIIGRNIRVLLPPDRLQEEDAIIARISRGERVEHFETVRLTRDHKFIEVSVTISPVKDATGRIVGASKIARDITERRLTEEALRRAKEIADRANADRLHLLEAERYARGEAEKASRTKDEFLATLSHELRTPLNAVLGWATVLRTRRLSGDELYQGIETIERNARVQAQIIDDLLDMSRIISGKVRLEVQRLNLSTVLREASETVRTAAEAKNVQLELHLPDQPVNITGDPSRLQQVFWNLLTNAIKFTPRDGIVVVQLEQTHSKIEVSITDTGEGIAPEMLPLVFDRFQQADSTTTRRHGGLGLGLSIVKQLVELHGGIVRVSSPGLGLGTTFVVDLPLAVSPQNAEEDTQTRARRQAGFEMPDVSLPNVRVLVVDDEADARALLKRLLSMAGATVSGAASAAEAFQRVSEEEFDILICDIGMPGEDGFSLIRRVRALPDPVRRNIPAIALTAYVRAEDRTESIRAGFQYHLGKPAEPAELLAIVQSLTVLRSKVA